MENCIEQTDKQIKKSKRIPELDMVKGLLIISVMMKHLNEILGLSASHPFVDSLFAWMMELFMIVFFILSGYVYTPKGSIGQQILKRLKQIFIPLLIYSTFNFAVYFVRYILIEHVSFDWFIQKVGLGFLGFTNRSFFCPPEDGPNLLNYGFVPFWFVHQLIPSFILFIIIRTLTDKRSFALRCVIATILITATVILSELDPQHTIRDTYNSYVPFSFVLINIIGFTGVMMIGNLLKEKNILDISSQSKVVSIAMFIFAATVFITTDLDYNPAGYALQYGRWGQYGAQSVIGVTIDGVFVTYFLVFIQHYVKRFKPLQKILLFFGQNSLTFLMTHLIIGETLCYIGGFWYPVYSSPYPVEKFSYLKWAIVIAITFTICISYILLKNLIKSKIAKRKLSLA